MTQNKMVFKVLGDIKNRGKIQQEIKMKAQQKKEETGGCIRVNYDKRIKKKKEI